MLMDSKVVDFLSKVRVGAIMDRPVAAFIIRHCRAVNDRPYKGN